MSGSSDPFCTLYLTTNPLARHYTSYKARTLNPIWNEDFVL
jgi:Ca2+-dependent lipid-binding protein